MGARKLRVPDDVIRVIRGLHPDLKKKVRAALQIILGEPGSGKVLKGALAGLRSFRVGRFRVIYRLKWEVIEIVAVGPRRVIHLETCRRIGK